MKNIAGQVLTYNSKNFNLLKKKIDLERTMSELGKPFPKTPDKIKNMKINIKMKHVNKKSLARRRNLVQTKTRPRMNYEWIGKTI